MRKRMSEQVDKLRATVTELQEELRNLDTKDAQARVLLESALDEISSALHANESGSLTQGSLLDRLRESAQHFEESHPALTRAVGNVADALSRLGI